MIKFLRLTLPTSGINKKLEFVILVIMFMIMQTANKWVVSYFSGRHAKHADIIAMHDIDVQSIHSSLVPRAQAHPSNSFPYEPGDKAIYTCTCPISSDTALE